MELEIDSIRTNLIGVNQQIQDAARSVNRPSEEIKLVVVTKSQPVELIRLALSCGIKVLGENYPQEALEKIALIEDQNPDVEWHMIGHLQSRKAKIIADHFSYLHSLDSYSLAEKLNRLLQERNKRLPVLLEMNVSGEVSKFGWPAWSENQKEEIFTDIRAILTLQNLDVRGLMTMPPLYGEPEKNRLYFGKLRELRDELALAFPQGRWGELSMGTSGDFQVAIQEGATFIRIGQAILGPRVVREK